METATAQAIKSFENDARFRAIAYSVVARAMADHGPVDPERADADAHDIALKVAVLIQQQILDGDAELVATRAERDAYKKLALEINTLSVRLPSIAIPA